MKTTQDVFAGVGIQFNTNDRTHIDLQYHFVRAKVKDGDVKLVFCPTEDMVADLLTKYLSTKRFQKLRDMMVAVG